jgi:murein DD-endopeptidase MepM/ murein hydrolase activator NlpD
MLGALLCGIASPSRSADEPRRSLAPPAKPEIAREAAERMLGSPDGDAQDRSQMLFTRRLGGDVVVAGSLRDSAAGAGIPAAAVVEAAHAFGTVVDLERDARDGDRLYVNYEQGFTAAGNPVGVPKLLWAEFQPVNKPAIGVHRFRPVDGAEQFWLADGQGTAAPRLRMPVDSVVVSSPFGMRDTATNDISKPLFPTGSVPTATARPVKSGSFYASASSSNRIGGRLDDRVDGPIGRIEPIGGRVAPIGGLEPPITSERIGAAPARAPMVHQVVMHEGVDLAATLGTPVLAAGDGVVRQAEARGGYGNWVMIDHDGGNLSTGYAHLLAFAPGLAAGTRVLKGEVIGFVGSTGHSTGPHVHYEVWVNGKAENPIGNAATLRARLSGVDLVHFQAQVMRSLGERNGDVLVAAAHAAR